MPISKSAGYEGSVDEPSWAAMTQHVGARYAVAGPNDWRVEVVPGADRTVRVRPGAGFGCGIYDVADTETRVQSPVVDGGNGTIRWDLICARRNWVGPGGVTTFDRVAGTSTQAVPADRKKTPGVEDDQPLALVQYVAGQQLAQNVVDLRSWPSKVMTAATLQAFPDAQYGDVVRLLDGREYRRQAVGNTEQFVEQNVLRRFIKQERLPLTGSDDVAAGDFRVLLGGVGGVNLPQAGDWAMDVTLQLFNIAPQGVAPVASQIGNIRAQVDATNLSSDERMDITNVTTSYHRRYYFTSGVRAVMPWTVFFRPASANARILNNGSRVVFEYLGRS